MSSGTIASNSEERQKRQILEEQLLKELEENDNVAIKEIFNQYPGGELEYHFSSLRENLISWFPFRRDATALEIRGGFGALTALLCSKLRHVTVLEPSAIRAHILLLRNKVCVNLSLHVLGFDAFESEARYDYIIAIDILTEASLLFPDAPNPEHMLLTRMRALLKPGGLLITALENKLALKYWQEVPTDYSSASLDAINSFNVRSEKRTYTREELPVLLREAGFVSEEFYYPIPNFVVPEELFSDIYLPSRRHSIRSGLLSARDASEIDKTGLMHQRLVTDAIISNNKFGRFANSFLIFARAE